MGWDEEIKKEVNKMAKCPICNEDIDSLYMARRVSAVFDMSYNVHAGEDMAYLELTHMPERDEEPDIRDTLDETYYCPLCDGEVAKSSDEALTILKGD